MFCFANIRRVVQRVDDEDGGARCICCRLLPFVIAALLTDEVNVAGNYEAVVQRMNNREENMLISKNVLSLRPLSNSRIAILQRMAVRGVGEGSVEQRAHTEEASASMIFLLHLVDDVLDVKVHGVIDDVLAGISNRIKNCLSERILKTPTRTGREGGRGGQGGRGGRGGRGGGGRGGGGGGGGTGGGGREQ